MNKPDNYKAIAEIRAQSLIVRGVNYHFSEWGDADAPLFFYLHGWADAGSTFQFVVDALAKRWRVVAPDWRGFGRTEHCGESYWFPDYLADLHEILNHYSPQEPVRLVGHSMGGNVCSLYAGTVPERVEAIVNVEGFGLLDADAGEAPMRFRQWLEAGHEPAVFSNYSDYSSLAQRLIKRNPKLSVAQADFVARQWACEDGDIIRLRADPKHKMPNPILYRRAEAEACWRNITARTLLVSGDRSPFAEKIDSAVVSPFPNSQSTSISGAGHMIHFEAPGRLASEIEAFFK